MIQRCYIEKCPAFKDYGGRGITVCDKWRSSFPAFLEDMGVRPHPGYTIERINNELGYFKDNCKWIPKGEQNWNTRRTSLITFNGKTQPLGKWAKEQNIPVTTLVNRLGILKWDTKKALTFPRQKTYQR